MQSFKNRMDVVRFLLQSELFEVCLAGQKPLSVKLPSSASTHTKTACQTRNHFSLSCPHQRGFPSQHPHPPHLFAPRPVDKLLEKWYHAVGVHWSLFSAVTLCRKARRSQCLWCMTCGPLLTHSTVMLSAYSRSGSSCKSITKV